MDTRDILTIKGLIRRGEARTACTYNNIPLERCHFLDLPFYETGKIQKNPISEDLKAFYEYHSILMEPWDGPACLAFQRRTICRWYARP